jgi:hypothetical protein
LTQVGLSASSFRCPKFSQAVQPNRRNANHI